MNPRPAIVFDVDGTICPHKQKDQTYDQLVPFHDVVTKMWELRDIGFDIILDTARNMQTYDGNIGRINAYTLPELVAWLKMWDIPYDEIHIGKAWPKMGYVIDDRAIRPTEFLSMSHLQIMNMLSDENEKMHSIK